jgi:hypothetical protein
MDSERPKTPEEIRAERRRERLKAFFTPWIYMGSIVASVALMMALIRTCAERFPSPP